MLIPNLNFHLGVAFDWKLVQYFAWQIVEKCSCKQLQIDLLAKMAASAAFVSLPKIINRSIFSVARAFL